MSDTSDTADVEIKFDLDVLLSLLKGEALDDLIKQNKLVVYGNVKIAQLLVDLLKNVAIDVEELLSKYTGDIVANQAGKLVKKIKDSDSDNNPVEFIKDSINTFLLSPTKSKLFKNNHY